MKTNVALILDKSGSMGINRVETISGFNEQLATLREIEGQEVGVTFTVFGTNVDIRYVDRPINEVENLNETTYKPIGWTALYDAVGTTIIKLEDEVTTGPDDAFLVMVFSDGKENTSKEYKSDTLASVIAKLQNTGKWTFSYFGSNQNLAHVAATLNIPTSNMCSFSDTSKAYRKMGRDTKRYFSCRSVGVASVMDFCSDDGSIGDADKE